MIDAKRTESILKQMAWECFEFWANELEIPQDGSEDRKVWERVIEDLKEVNHNPYTPQGDELDPVARAKFIKTLKQDLGI